MTNGGAKGREWKWTPDKERAALLLAQGKTWAAIEKEDGIPHSTLQKWKKHPEFEARIDEHGEDIVREARRIIRANTGKMVQRMIDAAFYATPRHSVQVAATKDILDRAGLKPVDKQQIEQNGDMTIRIVYADAEQQDS